MGLGTEASNKYNFTTFCALELDYAATYKELLL